jgi:large subunit ribosomal protein L15
MTEIRRRKKSRKLRGSRTHTWGQVGQHRAKGQKGGRGNTGGHKGGWVKTIKFNPDYFGKHGFTRYERLVTKDLTINVGEIDQNAEKLSKEKQEKMPVIDLNSLGYTKVLGSGKVTKALVVKAEIFSEKAREKIEEAGGKVITLEK